LTVAGADDAAVLFETIEPVVEEAIGIKAATTLDLASRRTDPIATDVVNDKAVKLPIARGARTGGAVSIIGPGLKVVVELVKNGAAFDLAFVCLPEKPVGVAAGGLMIAVEQDQELAEIPSEETGKVEEKGGVGLDGEAGGQVFVFEQQFGGFIDDVLGWGKRLTIEAMADGTTAILIAGLKGRGWAAVLTVDGAAGGIATPDGAGAALLAVGFEIGALGHRLRVAYCVLRMPYCVWRVACCVLRRTLLV